jgi:hypothetical protein
VAWLEVESESDRNAAPGYAVSAPPEQHIHPYDHAHHDRDGKDQPADLLVQAGAREVGAWVAKSSALPEPELGPVAVLGVDHFVRQDDDRSSGRGLDLWIRQVHSADLPQLQSLGAALQRDHTAVVNDLTLPHNSGAVEGNVNRIIL